MGESKRDGSTVAGLSNGAGFSFHSSRRESQGMGESGMRTGARDQKFGFGHIGFRKLTGQVNEEIKQMDRQVWSSGQVWDGKSPFWNLSLYGWHLCGWMGSPRKWT